MTEASIWVQDIDLWKPQNTVDSTDLLLCVKELDGFFHSNLVNLLPIGNDLTTPNAQTLFVVFLLYFNYTLYMTESEPPQAPPAKPEVNRDFAGKLFEKFMAMTRIGHEAGINTTAAQNEALRQMQQTASGNQATKSGEED